MAVAAGFTFVMTFQMNDTEGKVFGEHEPIRLGDDMFGSGV